jgi:hypothetical protein
MSYWNSKAQEIVRIPDRPWPDYPGWLRIDCGCCAGLEWGGESPRECRDCGGGGFLAKHVKSGVLADYPGGPLRGKD